MIEALVSTLTDSITTIHHIIMTHGPPCEDVTKIIVDSKVVQSAVSLFIMLKCLHG